MCIYLYGSIYGRGVAIVVLMVSSHNAHNVMVVLQLLSTYVAYTLNKITILHLWYNKFSDLLTKKLLTLIQTS